MGDLIDKVVGSILPAKGFSRIIVSRSAFEGIRDFAKANYPKEFVALLEGRIDKGTLRVEGIIYQHYVSDFNSATMSYNLPLLDNVVGSVHSHPSPDSRPSSQDLRLFGKRGMVHMIAAYPFTRESIACFDLAGNELDFTVS